MTRHGFTRISRIHTDFTERCVLHGPRPRVTPIPRIHTDFTERDVLHGPRNHTDFTERTVFFTATDSHGFHGTHCLLHGHGFTRIPRNGTFFTGHGFTRISRNALSSSRPRIHTDFTERHVLHGPRIYTDFTERHVLHGSRNHTDFTERTVFFAATDSHGFHGTGRSSRATESRGFHGTGRSSRPRIYTDSTERTVFFTGHGFTRIPRKPTVLFGHRGTHIFHGGFVPIREIRVSPWRGDCSVDQSVAVSNS